MDGHTRALHDALRVSSIRASRGNIATPGVGEGRKCSGGAHLRPPRRRPEAARHGRSEAHTSELQSLMRNSYAVFRLTNKILAYSHQYTALTKSRLTNYTINTKR